MMSRGWLSRGKGNEFQAKGIANAKVLRQSGWSRVREHELGGNEARKIMQAVEAMLRMCSLF